MRTLTAPELKSLLDAGRVTLLDVRTAEELEVARVAGARHIPLNELPARVQELDVAAAIVVMCHHGMRSAMACQILERNGFGDVSNLTGGIEAWSLQVDAAVPRY